MTLSELVKTPDNELKFYNHYLQHFQEFIPYVEKHKFHKYLRELIGEYGEARSIKMFYVMLLVALTKASPKDSNAVLRECVFHV